MEAIAANLILIIVLPRNCIHICLGRHGLMEGRIKNRNHRCVRHQRLAGKNSGQVRRVVQRSQIRNLTDCINDILIDDHRPGKLLSSVNNAVSDCADLLQRLDHTGSCIGQSIQHQADCLLMILNLSLCLNLAALYAEIFIGDHTINTDTLADSLRNALAGLRINNLKFK